MQHDVSACVLTMCLLGRKVGSSFLPQKEHVVNFIDSKHTRGMSSSGVVH